MVETPMSFDDSILDNSFVHYLMLSNVLFDKFDGSIFWISLDLPFDLKFANTVRAYAYNLISFNLNLAKFHWKLVSTLYVMTLPD